MLAKNRSNSLCDTGITDFFFSRKSEIPTVAEGKGILLYEHSFVSSNTQQRAGNVRNVPNYKFKDGMNLYTIYSWVNRFIGCIKTQSNALNYFSVQV